MISIAIPTYEMHNLGMKYLDFSLDRISKQTYKDIEIVISDHSLNNDIKNLCEKWSSLNIKYIRNEYNRGSSSSNINNAMKHCSGEYIKIIFQDDYLYDEDSIQNIMTFIDEIKPIWLATSCEHSEDGITCYNRFTPEWNDRIWSGSNSLSSPSVITIKNDNKIMFNDNLIWMMDCEWYQRLYELYGLPDILDVVTVVNRTWKGRLSDTISSYIKMKEVSMMYEKYNK